tara:strand:- start:57 stop:1028 length:972 start_codon:yes stop_codon:yes gene_type:complete
MGLIFIYLCFDKNIVRLYRQQEIYYCILVVVLLAQSKIGFILPNTDDAFPAVNGWYWNENDASLALGAFLFLSMWYGSNRYLIPFHLGTIYLMNFNGSRVTLAAIGLYVLLIYLVKPGKKNWVRVMDIALIITFVMGLSLYFTFGNFNRTLFFLAIEPLTNLITLTEYQNPLGSVQWRTQVSILGIKDLVSSYFMGTGAGSTINIIDSNYYLLNYIQSMHNLFLQMFVELGLFLSATIVIYARIKSPLKTSEFISVLIVFIIISLSQSGGILTNYSAMIAFFYTLLVDRKTFAQRYQKMSVTDDSLNLKYNTPEFHPEERDHI